MGQYLPVAHWRARLRVSDSTATYSRPSSYSSVLPGVQTKCAATAESAITFSKIVVIQTETKVFATPLEIDSRGTARAELGGICECP